MILHGAGQLKTFVQDNFTVQNCTVPCNSEFSDRRPELRMGVGEMLDHSFFWSFDVKMLMERLHDPPIVPPRRRHP